MKVYWTALILANIPFVLLAGRAIFGSVGSFLAAIGNGVNSRVWTMRQARREESDIIENFKASLVILAGVAAVLAEHYLFMQLGWI